MAMAYWKHRENIKRLLTGTERDCGSGGGLVEKKRKAFQKLVIGFGMPFFHIKYKSNYMSLFGLNIAPYLI